MNQIVFPNAKQVFLLSHPCEPEVFNRFPDSQMYLSVDAYNFYKDHWFSLHNVRIQPVVDPIEIEEAIDSVQWYQNSDNELYEE